MNSFFSHLSDLVDFRHVITVVVLYFFQSLVGKCQKVLISTITMGGLSLCLGTF
jgi:hypothetical protein